MTKAEEFLNLFNRYKATVKALETLETISNTDVTITMAFKYGKTYYGSIYANDELATMVKDNLQTTLTQRVDDLSKQLDSFNIPYKDK